MPCTGAVDCDVCFQDCTHSGHGALECVMSLCRPAGGFGGETAGWCYSTCRELGFPESQCRAGCNYAGSPPPPGGGNDPPPGTQPPGVPPGNDPPPGGGGDPGSGGGGIVNIDLIPEWLKNPTALKASVRQYAVVGLVGLGALLFLAIGMWSLVKDSAPVRAAQNAAGAAVRVGTEAATGL